MKKKIIVIEDEPQMRKNLSRILELENFNALTASDGASGLDLIQREHPDLILCDITLPEMDGLAVLKQLRSSLHTSLIPFIFLTAKGEKSDQRLGMTLGADDYLSKPFTPEDLLHAINSVLQKHHAWNTDTKNKLDYKSNFVTSVTHDLRSPLAVLLLNLDSLEYDKDSLLPSEHQELMHEMRCQITLMNRMIEDILTFGRKEAGTLPLQRMPLNLADLVNRVVKEVKLIDGREHHFETVPGELSETVCLDPLLTRQIVSNLLLNAVKYSAPNTAIEIHYSSEGEQVVIRVVDHGIGISEPEIEQIFQPFQRGTNINLQRGTGYGLFIVKNYVEWLGGTISVQSVPHKGSTFTVRLPANAPSSRIKPSEASPTKSAERPQPARLSDLK